MDNRTFAQAAALVAPPTARRPFSAGSVLMLEMAGNPFASLSESVTDIATDYQVAEAAWFHEIPLASAQAAAIASRQNPAGLRAVVLEWAQDKPAAWLGEMRQWLRDQVNAVSASMAVPEDASSSKNALGPCSLSA